MQVSKKFVALLKTHDLPAYRIAQAVGVNPVVLSKLIRGIQPVQPDDVRVLRVAAFLGLKEEEVFEPSRRP